jgi:hypothetical protein
MEDIRLFLRTQQPAREEPGQEPLQSDGEEDSEEWTDDEGEEEEGDSTMKEEAEASIGRSWRERMEGRRRREEEDKENRRQAAAGDRLEFSPPEKMPRNSPSYLIWSIFTK